MDFISSVLTGIFIAILVGVTLTFGLALLAWCVFVAVVFAVIVVARDRWRRWRFVRSGTPEPEQKAKRITVIEAEYEDITHKQS